MMSDGSVADANVLELFVVGFDGYDLPQEIADLLASGLAGVTLFRRNILDRAQVARLCAEIRSAASVSGMTPIIAVDQEGGRVQRLRNIGPLFPAMRDVSSPFDIGRAIGVELADLGFNLDFAPVLDVDTNPSNPIIGDRAFSDDPSVVASRAVELFKGLASAGVSGCGKHFPGHGDASADSHLELPEIGIDRATLEGREMIPFQAASCAGFEMIMTAHCLYPLIDPEFPATLSECFIRPYLRGLYGFDGVVITDDLGMKAVADRYDPRQIVTLGMRAGIDLFLHCGVAGESALLIEAMDSAVGSGLVSDVDFAASISRVRRFRSGIR